MGELTSQPPPENYLLQSGFSLEYDSERCLPPDIVSEGIGLEAAEVVNTIRFLHGNIAKPTHILELGVGSGVSLVSALSALENTSNIHIHAIDIDAYSVELSLRNLMRFASTHGIQPEVDILQGDWFDEKVWSRLRQFQYQAIIFNPPYLQLGAGVRAGYHKVPTHTMYAEDDGMKHYKQVFPQLAPLVSADIGSSLLIRRPRFESSAPNSIDAFSKLEAALRRQITNSSSIDTSCLVSADRIAHWTTIARTHDTIPAHKNPLVLIARKLRLNYVPSAEELIESGLLSLL